MAKITSHEEIDIPFLSAYAQEHDVEGLQFPINKLIVTNSGLMIILWKAPYNHFLFNGTKAYTELLEYVEESLKSTETVPAIMMRCDSGSGRKVSFMSDTKFKLEVEKRYTNSGNTTYHFYGKLG